MITDDYNLQEVLDNLPCSELNYEEWCTVGMALKTEDYPVSVWDEWSRQDASRYKAGECVKKWNTFKRDEAKAGTIIDLAIKHGWVPEQKNTGRDRGEALTWDSVIGPKSSKEMMKPVVDPRWIGAEDIPAPPVDWKPNEEIIRYIRKLFNDDEYIDIVTETYENEGSYRPGRGIYTKTAGEVIKRLQKYKADIGAAIGDSKPEAGAWVRFNPLDGSGIADSNVTAYRYALIESDSMPIDKQYAMLKALKLPIAVLVHSGGKSLHAIVRINAVTYKEYKDRVDLLYSICENSGFHIDKQNRNPSRLSRLPGIMRGDKPQYIVAEDMGLASWDEWTDYIQSINDDLPDIESFADVTQKPVLADELIMGILRQGHKMLIAGPSKAGKSFLLMELAISIAEGRPWCGHECMQGRVLYVNLELDDASCKNRIWEIYEQLNIPRTANSRNLDIWNLRGLSCPLNELTPRLIRRAKERQYTAVILDPLYKIITGDENSAEEMAKFCNLFDKISRQLKCAVIYCHHHSKGAQGGKKSMDRASGSGVFARDPDALIDMIELDMTQAVKERYIKYQKDEMAKTIIANDPNTKDVEVVQDAESIKAYLDAHKHGFLLKNKLIPALEAIDTAYRTMTAWRLEFTLREFAPHEPTNLVFRFPVHEVDTQRITAGLKASGEALTAEEKEALKKEQSETYWKNEGEKYKAAFNYLQNFGDIVTVADMAASLDIKDGTSIRNNVREHWMGLWFDSDEGIIEVDFNTWTANHARWKKMKEAKTKRKSSKKGTRKGTKTPENTPENDSEDDGE